MRNDECRAACLSSVNLLSIHHSSFRIHYFLMKTIGIVTGGGDAPGLNAVIRAAVKTAVNEYGLRVVGIEDGFEGLLGPTRVRELRPRTCADFCHAVGLSWGRATAVASSSG